MVDFIRNESKLLLFESLGYKPHPGQIAIHNLIDEFPVVSAVCGRRTGKTYSAAYEAIYQALQPGDEAGAPVVYIISDTYSHSKKIFNPVMTLFEQHKLLSRFLDKVYRKDQILLLKGGAEIYSKSADTPASLAGDSVSFAVIDEAGFVNDDAIEVLRPAFAARSNPKRLNIGTPDRSDTFFYKEYQLGMADSSIYSSITLPSSSNPLVSSSYLENERSLYSDSYFRKMYLAEFSQVDNAPFSDLVNRIDLLDGPEEPKAGHKYVAGIDLADRNDDTVVTIVDVTNKPYKLVNIFSWRGLGYEVTGVKISALLKKYNYAHGYADRTGVGDAAVSFITREYGNITPIVFSLSAKQTMFDSLYTHLEKRELLLYNNEKLINELRNLRAIQRTKGVSYQAPPGLHDDFAMSLFLATNGFKRQFGIPKNIGLGGYARPL
jgi:phage FluMu gp28-like protein